MLKSMVSAGFTVAIVIGSLVGGYASADEIEQPAKVSVPLLGAYIPGGFDSNDRTQLVVEGYFPNTCYRVGPYEKKLDNQSQELTIRQMAYKYKGQCLFMLVPFTQTVQVGLLKASTYKVKDADSGKDLGALPVQVAKNSSPDDFLYASVTDAYVGVVDGNKKAIILQGDLPGDCWAVKEKRVILDGKNVIAVLPIIEKIRENNCNEYRIPFVTTAELPAAPAGRYLLHVRSLNGLAVNKIVDL
jgi:hypothetical protein